MPLKPFEKSEWLWPGLPLEIRNTYADFRRDFRLAAAPRTAPFHVTADQNYMLYANGRYVGRGPARGFQSSWPYDTHELSPLLRKGANWISVRVYNSGSSSGQYLYQGKAGLICAGTAGGVDLATNGSWLKRLTPGNREDTARLSWLLGFQEQADLRKGDQSWITSAAAPRDWTCDPWSVGGAAPGCMPWPSFEPRGIANLGSRVIPYSRTRASASGRCDPGWEAWTNASTGARGELAAARWTAGAATGPVVRFGPTGRNRWRAVILDMGGPVIGTLIVDASGARGGEGLDFLFTEILNGDGSPMIPDGRLGCGSSMAARLRLRPGRNRHEFFQLIGHRYLVAMVRDAAGPLSLRLSLRYSVYPMDVAGRFETDHPVINGIHRICVDTQRACALDSYVDTPWREQAQWWGDARVQAQNTFHLCDDTRLVVRGIRQIGTQDVPNGLTYGHAPTCFHHCILPDFSLIWLLTIWDHYHQTGDSGLFVEQWPRARRVLDYFLTEGRDKRTGLLRYDPRYWLFLDWTEIHKDPIPTLLNLWHVLALRKMGDLAAIAGMRAEGRDIARRLADQVARVNRHLWDAKAGLFHDGLDRAHRPVPVHSVHNQTLAIHAGLQPSRHADFISKSLLPYARDDRAEGVARPSSYWVTYVYEALAAAGHRREVVGHILRHYAKMVPGGGTWENFDVMINDTIASRSHAWSAHPIYHFARNVGGVTQTATAWRRIG